MEYVTSAYMCLSVSCNLGVRSPFWILLLQVRSLQKDLDLMEQDCQKKIRKMETIIRLVSFCRAEKSHPFHNEMGCNFEL